MMHIDQDSLVKLNAIDIIQYHLAIIGMTNSGKTNTLSVLIEELSAAGTKVTVVDPEGDYGDLRFGTKALIVGKGRKGNHIDIELTPDNAAAAADVMCRYDTPVIVLDISGFDITVRDEFVLEYVGQLWKNYQQEDFPPHRLIVDEVQIFAPQGPQTASKTLFKDMMARARKRNLTLGIATQQPQSVDKTVLNQTYIRIFHHVAKGTALKAIRDLLPGSLVDVPGKAISIEDRIADMKTGDAIWMTGNNAKLVHIFQSRTFHPQNGAPVIATQLPFDDGTLDKLRGLISANQVAEDIKADVKGQIETDKCIEELKTRILELEAENTMLRGRIADMPSPQTEGSELTLPPASLTVPLSSPIDGRDRQRQSHAEGRDLERQTRGYRNLLLTITKQSRLDRQIISFLVDHEPARFDAMQLALAVGHSTPSHINMTYLVKIGIVRCVKLGRKKEYQSLLLEKIQQDYPLIDRAQAIEDIARLRK